MIKIEEILWGEINEELTEPDVEITALKQECIQICCKTKCELDGKFLLMGCV